MAIVRGDKSLLLPTLPNGDPNPLYDLINYADMMRIPIEVKGSEASIGPMSDFSVLNLPTVASIVALGADVYRYPAWIVVDDLTADVPSYVTDPDPAVPWQDWLDENHEVTVLDGKNYVPSDGSGQHLLGSQLDQLITDSWIVKTLPEMQDLVQQFAPESP